MPRYKVKENRIYEVEYLIDADSEKDAGKLNGTIIEEQEWDASGYELLSVELWEDKDFL